MVEAMKVPCEHGHYDAHEYGGTWECRHGPGVSHVVSCGPLIQKGGTPCSGGESPTNNQLITELRKRGVTVDWNIA